MFGQCTATYFSKVILLTTCLSISHSTGEHSYWRYYAPECCVLKYTKPVGGLKGLSEPGARNLSHLAYATLGDPPRRGNLFRSAQQFCCTPQESICAALHLLDPDLGAED
jgi:hypothetical protein